MNFSFSFARDNKIRCDKLSVAAQNKMKWTGTSKLFKMLSPYFKLSLSVLQNHLKPVASIVVLKARLTKEGAAFKVTTEGHLSIY